MLFFFKPQVRTFRQSNPPKQQIGSFAFCLSSTNLDEWQSRTNFSLNKPGTHLNLKSLIVVAITWNNLWVRARVNICFSSCLTPLELFLIRDRWKNSSMRYFVLNFFFSRLYVAVKYSSVHLGSSEWVPNFILSPKSSTCKNIDLLAKWQLLLFSIVLIWANIR
jgi:hypothetical protein